MNPATLRRTATLTIGALALSGVAIAQPDWHKSEAARAQMDVDMTELPPQVPPPSPGDSDWPFHNRTPEAHRTAPQTQITPDNVSRLAEVCRVRLSGPGPLSAGQLLANGMLYTTAANATIALDPTTCDVVWKAIYPFSEGEVYNANRGPAYMQGRLYRGTGDGRLVAYDAMTGHELWRVKAGDPKRGEYVVAAPLAWDGLVYAGIAAGDLGIAGRMMAFDARTGEKRWTFNLIPTPGEPGNETWPGESWKTGGGGTWSTFTLDPATGELFIPVANPAPAFDPSVRKGDNLYTNSALVLDAKSGAYRWHYQTLPNDSHDYGVSPPGVLVDLGPRKLLAQASKDGHVYMIDRATHRLAWKTLVTTIENFGKVATSAGVRICPGAKGGVEYSAPGYDAVSGLLVVGSVDWCYVLVKADYPTYSPGQPYLGGRMERGDANPTGWITAIDARTGKVRWKMRTPAPMIGAVTPTAAGLTFAGDASGTLYALRTADGKVLWRTDTGGALAGGIITYRIRGRQYLAVSSGNISRSSWPGVTGVPTMIVYALPAEMAVQDAGAGDLPPDPARGGVLYRNVCASCHGAEGQGGSAPRLAGLGRSWSQDKAVAYIRQPSGKMPALWPKPLGDRDVADVAAFVLGL